MRERPNEGLSAPSRPRKTRDPTSVADGVEDGVPNVRFDMGPMVFVQAFARASVLSLNFDGLTDPHVEGKFFLFFSLHSNRES